MSKYDILLELVDFFDSQSLSVNSYYEDGGYSSLFDSVIYGKINALRSALKQFGFDVLLENSEQLDQSPGNVIHVLEVMRGFLLPELKRQIEERIASGTDSDDTSFWELLHPRIQAVSKSRFQSGHYADAVEAALKDVNVQVKAHYKLETGKELDGAGLMTTAFSLNNPIIKLADLTAESGKNIQQGYMQIFAGAMIGVRNPNAHDNLNVQPKDAIHMLFLASLLMYKFDARI